MRDSKTLQDDFSVMKLVEKDENEHENLENDPRKDGCEENLELKHKLHVYAQAVIEVLEINKKTRLRSAALGGAVKGP